MKLDPNVSRLYRATFLFGLACGISIALTSLHLDTIGYDKRQIGTLAAWFASGIVAMSIPAGALIRRFSARPTLIAFMIGYSICVAAFPFVRSYEAIAAVRAADGACSVGIWVCSETILLSRAEPSRKAHLTSLYAVWLSCGYVVGPMIAKLVVAFSSMRVAFVLAGTITILASGYIVARFVDDGLGKEVHEETAGSEPPTSLPKVLWRIKNSAFATFAYGYFQASVVLFLPLYLIESKHVPRDRTIVLPALFCVGMLLGSNPVGRLADRVGHLLVMRLLAIVGTTMIFGFVFLDSYTLMLGAVAVAGATLATMSPVSLALQGVVTEQKDISRANSLYNLFYAAGMLLGPPISSQLFGRFGGKVMLYHLAALFCSFILFSIVFMYDDPATRRRRAHQVAV